MSLDGGDTPKDFEAIVLQIASPDKIRFWSNGEVKKPETINYRTFKPEKDGLFCERLFGPSKDWECHCGKYKRMKYKDIVCDRCGVKVTQSKVRREWMGHIELAVPVTHIWFFKVVPSRIGSILDITQRNLERVIYFQEYVVLDPGDTPLEKKSLLTEDGLIDAREQYGESFEVGMGAEAVERLLREEDLEGLAVPLREEMKTTRSRQTCKKLARRLKVIESFLNSDNRPEWMVLRVLPVIPPDLRPLVALDGGRFATSDVNDLYRRVINRNNRLRKLIELKAPEVILRNEKRMLQEAVDALMDNGRHGRVVQGAGGRPLKSLSDMLKGKQGRFRQNLLGKRVDYSGRSVIVIGPELKLHQCGLPKKMALELFEPFIIGKLQERNLAATIKTAKKMVQKESPEVWDILEDVISDHLILLNRAPTLHRLSMQAFEPSLIEGSAIRIHPLVCAAFNADFDGDQMAVHVPLFTEAQLESRLLMLSTNNILSPASGQPKMAPSQDIVIGCSYLTKMSENRRENLPRYFSIEEAVLCYEHGYVDLHEPVFIRLNGKNTETTVGRAIFNEILPEELRFQNEAMDRRRLSLLVYRCFRELGQAKTVVLLDHLKDMGFWYATKAGLSFCVDDMTVPLEKQEIISLARKEVSRVESSYRSRRITDGERYNRVIDIWTRAGNDVADALMETLAKDQGGFNPIHMMADSGARGSQDQVRQLAGMRGLMAKVTRRIEGRIGEIVETPVTSNFREGLSVLEYFVSTHGARKGLADTALKTADAGYLTRRLVDCAQDVIIMERDCGTLNGIDIEALEEAEEVIVPLEERVLGRVALDDVIHPVTGEVMVQANEEIEEEKAKLIGESGLESVPIRSVLTCECRHGVCALCYGRDLARSKLVNIGEAVGIIAAQSIGEPGTQLTLRTFHIGGLSGQMEAQSRIEARHDGQVKYHNIRWVKNKSGSIIILNANGELSVDNEEGRELERYSVVSGAEMKIEDGASIKTGNTLFEWDPFTVSIITEKAGKVTFMDIVDGITMREQIDEITRMSEKVVMEHREELYPQLRVVPSGAGEDARYPLPAGAHLIVEDGEKVEAGDVLAKTPRKTIRTKDITGGLPRVEELFEGRKPRNPGVIAEIDGIISVEEDTRGRRRITVRNEDTGDEKEYVAPHGKHLNVATGDFVIAGERLVDGPVVPQDILRVSGEKELQKYLVNQVQHVYRIQGERIHDKHMEIIVRQMLKKVQITEVGDTRFLVNQQAFKFEFQDENERVIKEGGKPAVARPVLLGATKASLSTQSFISAASFQETTRVLTDAAIRGAKDDLRGLKENVIIGHLIPAGTGRPEFRNTKSKLDVPTVADVVKVESES